MQAAVDAATQVIVGTEVVGTGNDKEQLAPMVERVEAELGQRPGGVSADSGY